MPGTFGSFIAVLIIVAILLFVAYRIGRKPAAVKTPIVSPPSTRRPTPKPTKGQIASRDRR